MLSTDEKQYYQEVLQINTYGLSNIIRNIAKKKNKDFYKIDRNDLEEYVDSQNDENAFWDEIFKICEENNYSGNKKFILNTISHMKDKRCHTDDKIKNVKNYFEIMKYNQYLKENKLSELICQCCGKKFLDKPNTKYCQECWVDSYCCECGVNLNRKKFKNDNKDYYCNSCKGKKSVESNKKSGNCTKCGINNVLRDQNGRGKDGIENGGCNCSQDFYNKHNSSPKMRYQGKKALQDFYKTEKGQEFIIEHNQSDKMRQQAVEVGKKYGSINITNYNKSEKHKEIARIIGLTYGIKNLKCEPNFIQKDVLYYKNEPVNKIIEKLNFGKCDVANFLGWNKRWCENCNMEEWHYETKCLICGNINKIDNSNFTNKNGVKLYKCEPVEEVSAKILSGEYDINNFPGFNIRFGHVCYETEDIITGENYLFNNSNFVIHKDVLYYYDNSISDYVPWNEYKIKFSSINVDFELPKDFINIPTYRTQESQDWTGAKTAFEQSLIDLNINWFVYIKYYINNENQILPLVVGKSGSLNVNKNGSDVNFSENVNDGPARRFLNENRYSWCKTQISILKCISEQEALNIEKEIHDKYGLFYS